MAKNLVEYHIPSGSFHTFKVAPAQTVKIGQFVEVAGDLTVKTAGAGSLKVIGQVYSGSVGVDGVGVGYRGDAGDVVTVIALKPITYAKAGGAITAGANLKTTATGDVVVHVEATDSDNMIVATALEAGASGAYVTVIHK